MTDQKELQLLIQARLKGGRDLDSITKSVKDLEEAINQQAEAAKRGESAYEGLKAAAAGLRQVQDELGARGKALGDFKALTDRINDQREAVTKTEKALSSYLAKVGDDRTEKQQQRVEKLTASFDRASKKLKDYQSTFSTLGAALRESGVDTGQLADEQSRVAEQQIAVAQAQKRLTQELVDYNTNVRIAREAIQAKGKADRDAARDADFFAAAEKRAADALAERTKRNEEVAESRLNRRSQSAAEGNQFDDDARNAKRVRELADLRADIERRSAEAAAQQAQVAKDSGLTKQAQDAERAARSYTTLAKASQNLRPKVVSLRDAIASIVDPAANARSTLAGIEEQVVAASAAISKSGGAVVDYSDRLRDLLAIQKSIAQQGGLIDQFQRQVAAVRSTRTEYAEARAQVLQYAAAVKQGGEAGAQFVKPLAEAQSRLKAASAALREQVSAAQATRESLRAAGIDTANLANAQQRLINATKQSAAAVGDLSKAVERNGEAAKAGAKGFSLFRDEGRTTLSLMQRVRGELLALTATYVGIQGAIGLAADALKSFTARESLQNSLSFAFGGDQKQVAAEIAFITKEAERLGIAFEEAAKGYTKFSVAAVKSGASIEETRQIFTAFSEVGRVLNLTPDALNGIFNALSQSFSKGKIQAEELRQQIGERLPGAFAFAQEALKDVFPNLDKALEQGQVGANNLLLIAQSIQKSAAGQVAPAIRSLDSEQQRFNTSVFFFKQQIADAGFADAYVALLKQLTEFFKSDDGKKFAQSIGEIATAFVNGISTLVTYREELSTIAMVFASILAGGLIAKTGTSLVAFATAAKGAAIAGAILAPVTISLANAFRLLGAAVAALFIGFTIGDWLNKNFEEVRFFGVALITGMAEIWSKIKFGAMELWEELPRLAANSFKSTINLFNNVFTRPFLLAIKNIANALNLTSLSGAIDKAIGAISLNLDTAISSRTAEIRRQGEEDLRRIRGIADDMFKAARDPRITPLSARDRLRGIEAGSATFPDAKVRPGNPGGDGDGVKKRANEIETIRNALESLEAKSLKKQQDTLSSLLEAIDKETADLERRIAKLGGAKGAQFADRFRQAVNNLKGEVTRDFNEALLKEQEEIAKKLDQVDAGSNRKRKESLDGRLAAVRLSLADEAAAIEAFRQRLLRDGRDTAPADNAARRLQGLQLELENAERLNFLRDELKRKEQEINDLLRARTLAIEAVQNQVAAKQITQADGDTQIQGIIAQAQPGIEAATEASRTFAEANRAAFDPATMQEFLNRLAQARNSGAALNEEFNRTGKIISSNIDAGITKAFDAMLDTMLELKKGTADWGDVFDNVGKSILATVGQIFRELLLLIVRQQVLAAWQAVTGTTGSGAASSMVSGGILGAHSGAIVGHSSSGGTRRNAAPEWFTNAPRYHQGGIVGLQPYEVPAILKRNEEVLSESDPRNALNGGLMPASPGGSDKGMQFVLVDERKRIAEGLNTPEGRQAQLVFLKNNAASVRATLGIR